MNRVEQLIPDVMKVLKDTFKNGEIPSTYNGYISAFGAGVMMNGLKPTVAMYENKKADTKEDRAKLTNVILEVLKKRHSLSGDYKNLLDYILNYDGKESVLKKEILDIATAVKLCIRTFKLVKKDKKD